MNYYHPTTLEHIKNPLPAVADWAGATDLPVPDYDPQTQQCMFVSGTWAVEAVPGKTNAEITQELTTAVQNHLDVTAQARNYDGILSACTYAGSTDVNFAAEGKACLAWRDACWTKCYSVVAACLAGTRTVPTATQLIAELPVLTWP